MTFGACHIHGRKSVIRLRQAVHPICCLCSPKVLSESSNTEVVMNITKRPMDPRRVDLVWPAVITGIVLCLANYSMDFVMNWLGTSASKTFLNDVAIGILGGLAVFFYLSASYAQHNFESARERILLIRELNLRIRGAMELFAASAISDDPFARLQGIDEATDRIDHVLADFMMERKCGAAPGSGLANGHESWSGPDAPEEL